ncbi:hypothetical protein EYR97_19755 [Alteromonas sp. KUL42]|uniref:hypothetical protein n=1 Tax=Alteromonas sp. KUL42 TaxID=2480797 RepID=UPI001035D154|nr:hypothetical protein [Alteromonas sp. KUL42]TAP31725.1 hypothetical protein EYR97_19755 [Alteromonas sp. KUL42]
MKNIMCILMFCILTIASVRAEEVQLNSVRANIQVFTSNASLVGVDYEDYEEWRGKVKRYLNNNGELNLLLEAQGEMSRTSIIDHALERKDFDSLVDVEFNSVKDKLSRIKQNLSALNEELEPLKSVVSDYEAQDRENEAAIENAKVKFENSRERFKSVFTPNADDKRAKKKFDRNYERNSFFKVIKIKGTDINDCRAAILEDAGKSKSKLQKLRELYVGEGKRDDEKLYCPVLEFNWIPIKNREAYKANLSNTQKEIAVSTLNSFLLSENKKFARVFPDIIAIDVRKQHSMNKRKLDEVQQKVINLESELRYVNSIKREDVERLEKEKLALAVNKNLMPLIEKLFVEIYEEITPLRPDGYISFERESDLYFVVYENPSLPGYYIKIREGIKSLNVDNAVDIIGVLSL